MLLRNTFKCEAMPGCQHWFPRAFLIKNNKWVESVSPWRYELCTPFSTASFSSFDSCPSTSVVNARSHEAVVEDVSTGPTASSTVTTCLLSPTVRSSVSTLSAVKTINTGTASSRQELFLKQHPCLVIRCLAVAHYTQSFNRRNLSGLQMRFTQDNMWEQTRWVRRICLLFCSILLQNE